MYQFWGAGYLVLSGTSVRTSLLLFYYGVLFWNFPIPINLPFQTCGHWLREYLLGNALGFADLTFPGFILRTPWHNQSLCHRCPRHCLKKNFPDQKLMLWSVWTAKHHHKAAISLLVTYNLLKPWCLVTWKSAVMDTKSALTGCCACSSSSLVLFQKPPSQLTPEVLLSSPGCLLKVGEIPSPQQLQALLNFVHNLNLQHSGAKLLQPCKGPGSPWNIWDTKELLLPSQWCLGKAE